MHLVHLTKTFEASCFHWYAFPFQMIQFAYNEFLLMKTQRASLKQIEQMCKCALS